MTKTLHVVRVRDGIVDSLNNEGLWIDKHVNCLEDKWEAYKQTVQFQSMNWGTLYFVNEVDPSTGGDLTPYRYHEVWICQRGVVQKLDLVGDLETGMIGPDHVVAIVTTNDGMEYGFVNSVWGDRLDHSHYYGDAIMLPCENAQEAAAVNRILEKLSNGITLSVPLVMKRIK
ncbi:hypothetical protein [Pseudomonas phage PA1C]|uniref:Uncharacterized protein n=2 Tax=root TaxID=1 RepID=A0A5C1K861_9CAUD|nr:hypothetical protein PP933_gp351 [Pseudomonas phage vB_PaeM_PS119XW]QBX32508.1 hypothetical protein [Pseudomonas phage PA1C]QEM42080.1 hypothetical protein [Pseudomonas phage vB_PaeM_PS119XW]